MLTTILPSAWIIVAIASGLFLLFMGVAAVGLIVYTLVRRANRG